MERYEQTHAGEVVDEWHAHASCLTQVPVDRPSVLLLSHMENFRDGTMLVRERQGLHFDIFRSCALAKDTAGAIQALKKYGPEDPQLYPTALAYFTSSTRVVEEAGDEIERVLSKIDEDGLMAPLQVIQMLSATGVATVGMIRKYMRRTIDRERQEIETVSVSGLASRSRPCFALPIIKERLKADATDTDSHEHVEPPDYQHVPRRHGC